MTLAVFAVYERVRLATGTVSRIAELWYLVRRAMGYSGLCGIGLSGGFGMTTLGGGAWSFSLWGRQIVRRMGLGRGYTRVSVVVVIQR